MQQQQQQQPRLLVLYGIVFMSWISSAVAQTMTPDSEDCSGLHVKELSSDNVKIEWEKICFGEDETSYVVELIGVQNCTNDQYVCPGTGTTCEIDFIIMGCIPIDEPACSEVTYNVYGRTTNVYRSLTTQLAPWIKPENWNLENSIIEESTLQAKWGPPGEPNDSDVSCAEKVTVEAACNNGKEMITISEIVYGLDPSAQGNVNLHIIDCKMGEDIMLTVTYMMGDEDLFTDTTKSIGMDYGGAIGFRCYLCNDYDLNSPIYDAHCGLNSYSGTLSHNASYHGCYTEIYDNGYVARGGVMANVHEGCKYWFDHKNCYCRSAACNNDLCPECVSTHPPISTHPPNAGLACYNCIGCSEVDENTEIVTNLEFTTCVTTVILGDGLVIRSGAFKEHVDGECDYNEESISCFCTTDNCNGEQA